MDMQTIVLDTHYAVVRYLYYDVFKTKRSQINDLQNQMLFLKCINKYLLCRTGHYALLYNMYTNLDNETIAQYYRVNRLKMNNNNNEWLNFSDIILAPTTLPTSIDGPYMIDNMSLRRYTYFWTPAYNMKSNIIVTPFFCLDGIDYLYYEMITWKTLMMDYDKRVSINMETKHIFHDIYYIVHIKGKTSDTENIDIRFLVWLDDVDMQTELYVNMFNRDTFASEVETIRTNEKSICLLKQLYIACDNSVFLLKLSDINITSPILDYLNLFINNLSQNFIVTFDGRPPLNMTNTILDVTYQADEECSSNLDFKEISVFGYNPNISNQVYSINNIDSLNISFIKTQNFLVLQEEMKTTHQPTIKDMNICFQKLLFFLSNGMLNENIYTRMYVLLSNTNILPNSSRKQLNLIYIQKYSKFAISREQIHYDTTFYSKAYVFSARNLLCTVKSIKYLIKNVLRSSVLLPACVISINKCQEKNWTRLSQNIIYLQNIFTLCFLRNFTLQENQHMANDTCNTNNYDDFNNSATLDDIKPLRIVHEKLILDQLNDIFLNKLDINRLDKKTITTIDNIDLKCITLNNINFKIYYFTVGPFGTDSYENNFKIYFQRYMHTNDTKKFLDDKIYSIFLHLLNLYTHNVII